MLYNVYAECHPTRIWVLSSYDKSEAEDFAFAENEREQADVLTVESVSLVDDYGYPTNAADYYTTNSAG